MLKSVSIFATFSLLLGYHAHSKATPHDWHDSPHHVSVLLASTDVDEAGSAFTVGFDYEYRVSDFLGLGVVAEYAFEDIDAYTYLLVADLHITNSFIAQIGPGIEFHGGDKIEVARLGLLYEFELSGLTLSPQLHYDYHKDHADAIVTGVAIGFAF